MRENIVIGSGNAGCTAISTFIECDYSISENNISYWISKGFFNVDLTIFKDTEEGIKLTKLIEPKPDSKKISSYLDSLVLKHANVQLIKKLIENKCKESFEKGVEHNQYKVLSALGLK